MLMNKQVMNEKWDPASHMQKATVIVACVQWTKHKTKLIAAVIIAQTQS
jgi:hypothetical protein